MQLYPHQVSPALQLSDAIRQGQGRLLVAPTGSGKTFMLGQALADCFASGHLTTKRLGFEVHYVTKPGVIPQTREVLFKEFSIPLTSIFVTSYPQLRSGLGELFVEWRKTGNIKQRYKVKQFKDAQGKVTVEVPYYEQYEEEIPHWRKEFMPKVMVADECQSVKNEDSDQTQLLRAYVRQGGILISASATPFATIEESKTVCLSLRPKLVATEYSIKVLEEEFLKSDQVFTLNENLWTRWAQAIAGSQSSPSDINSESMKRLREVIAPYTIHVSNVRFKHKTQIACKLIPFTCEKDKFYYVKAYEDYLAKLAKVDRQAPGGISAIWTATQQFRIRGELIQAKYLAQLARELSGENAVILGSNFLAPLRAIKNHLLKLGAKPEEISEIVGGQNEATRQANIKAFQNGTAKYCLLTLGSGGVGLSLHHHEKNKDKTKPRYVILPPTWSAIEMVQVLGRGHRINSISDTHQIIVGFAGTVVEEVFAKLEKRIHSLREMVGKKENWADMFSKGYIEKEDFEQVEDKKQVKELAESNINNQELEPQTSNQVELEFVDYVEVN